MSTTDFVLYEQLYILPCNGLGNSTSMINDHWSAVDGPSCILDHTLKATRLSDSAGTRVSEEDDTTLYK